MKARVAEFIVGIFIIVAVLALFFLAFKVSEFRNFGNGHSYQLTAEFDNIGGLKVRAPVSVSGVRVGEVLAIGLDKNNFRAKVTMKINKAFSNFPTDTTASIYTLGILGSNYVSLAPGFDETSLKNNDRIETTHPALVLENLIGQLIYSMKSDDDKSNNEKPATKPAATPKREIANEH